MSEMLHRIWGGQPDLEIRGDGRTVYGLAVPYDQPAEIRDYQGTYTEVFRYGAFKRTIDERGKRVKFLANHDRQKLPLGKAMRLEEQTAGLVGEFRVSATPEGDAALELIRDGVLDSLSIGFKPVDTGDRWNPDRTLVERTEVALMEVSAVAFPAYDGALISGVRHDSDLRHASEGPDSPQQADAPHQRTTDEPPDDEEFVRSPAHERAAILRRLQYGRFFQ